MTDADHVLAQINVSRETSERLKTLADLLVKWNPRINLVSKSTIEHLWTRHILDSAQIFQLSHANCAHWVDIGSGGGFPGLVVALMVAEANGPQNVTLIESDQRKCAFLRTVLRETGVSAKVVSERIEAVEPQKADILSARALADLPLLLDFAHRHLAVGGFCVFPKGATWEKEVEAARKSWSFDLEVIQSITEPQAVILKVGELLRV